jgi:hypothetical protein
MTGVVGALVALGVVLAIVVGLAVRPPARRVTQALGELRTDTVVRLARLRDLRAVRRSRTRGPRTPVGPSTPAG